MSFTTTKLFALTSGRGHKNIRKFYFSSKTATIITALYFTHVILRNVHESIL